MLDFKARLSHLGTLVEDVDYHLTMLEGPVADCLLRCATEKKIDLLVVGTHGRRGLGKFILGSVAEKVFRHSPVPVLTVGPNIHEPREINLTRHVLAPCDLTPRSHPAVQYACTLAEAHNSRLTVLHVVERLREVTNLDPHRVKQGIRENLADIAGKVRTGVDADYRVEFGNVPANILRVASETAANLIVVGVRRSAGLLDRFIWPIAYELVCEAACPVLTIRGVRAMKADLAPAEAGEGLKNQGLGRWPKGQLYPNRIFLQA